MLVGTPGRKCPSKTLFPETACAQCVTLFDPNRAWQKFCSAKCRDMLRSMSPWGNSRKRQDETEEEFKNRIRTYERKGLRRWTTKNISRGLCRACPAPALPGTKCWCEKHWFAQAAWRNGLRGKEAGEKVKVLLEKQNHTCPYTGKKLVIGVNASIDHKNPRSRFPDQSKSIENAEWVDLNVNRAKRAMTKEEFIELCTLIAERHKK